MKKIKYHFFVLMMIHNIQAMDREKSEEKMMIKLVGYRSGINNRWFNVAAEDSNAYLWKKLCDGADYIERYRVHCEPFSSDWTIKKNDIPTLMNMYKNVPQGYESTLTDGQAKLKEYQKKMKLIPIRAEISPSTAAERMSDKFLHGAPLSLGLLVPHLIMQHAEGIGEIVGASILGAVGLFVVGEYIYPALDSYNSGVGKLSEYFGKENHKRVKRGQDLVCGSALVYIYTQFFLKIVPKCSKIFAFIYNETIGNVDVSTVSNTLHTLVCFWQFGSFISAIDHFEYKEPFDRFNKYYTYYTLGDLIDYETTKQVS